MDARNTYRREINKYIEQNCAPSWIYLRDYTEMHSEQNIKFEFLSTSLMKVKYFVRYHALFIGKSYRRFGRSCCLHLQGLSSPRRGIGNYLLIDVTPCLDSLFYVYRNYNNSPIKIK